MGSSSSLLQIFASSAAPLACFDVVLLQLDGAIFLMRERGGGGREERSGRGDCNAISSASHQHQVNLQ